MGIITKFSDFLNENKNDEDKRVMKEAEEVCATKNCDVYIFLNKDGDAEFTTEQGRDYFKNKEKFLFKFEPEYKNNGTLVARKVFRKMIGGGVISTKDK